MTGNEGVLRWFEKLVSESNAAFVPLFFDKHRYLVLKGGGGSGKSIFAGRKVLERVTTEPGHRWLVCRKVAKTLRESCFAQLAAQCAKHYPLSGYHLNRTEMRITFKNGSEILFAGLDDVEKLKSIYDITGIWIEEASELAQSDFNQLDIRLRANFDHYLQIILSFNPISIKHWLKKRFWDTPDERARVHESTYKDNRFLPKEAAVTLESFKDTDEYYYTVYCLGRWGVTGKSVFNSQAVAKRLEEIGKCDLLVCEGFFTFESSDALSVKNPCFTEEKGAPVRVYEKPLSTKKYVIGADTAGEGSDFFVAQVLESDTGRQVCTLRHRFDEDIFAKQLYCLGRWYNDALIAVETNFSTYPVKLLDLMGYPRLYVRQVEDDYTGAVTRSYGFKTTSLTRPVMISGLISFLRESVDSLSDEETLSELLTFVRNDKLRAEAEPGAHDDCVMALAIAHYIRPVKTSREEKAGCLDWSPDQWQDYEAASAHQRQYLMKIWGPQTDFGTKEEI